jgi:hypothetical protein
MTFALMLNELDPSRSEFASQRAANCFAVQPAAGHSSTEALVNSVCM